MIDRLHQPIYILISLHNLIAHKQSECELHSIYEMIAAIQVPEQILQRSSQQPKHKTPEAGAIFLLLPQEGDPELRELAVEREAPGGRFQKGRETGSRT